MIVGKSENLKICFPVRKFPIVLKYFLQKGDLNLVFYYNNHNQISL